MLKDAVLKKLDEIEARAANPPTAHRIFHSAARELWMADMANDARWLCSLLRGALEEKSEAGHA